MAQLAVIALGIGAGVQAFGAIQQGRAAEAQGKLDQQIADQNALLKERQAALEVERAREEARIFGREGEALLGTQQVALAKGGVLTSIGTPAFLLEETERELELDRRAILKEGFLAESFRLSEAENLRFGGRVAKARGKNLRRASTFGAVGSILTGFGDTAVANKLLT